MLEKILGGIAALGIACASPKADLKSPEKEAGVKLITNFIDGGQMQVPHRIGQSGYCGSLKILEYSVSGYQGCALHYYSNRGGHSFGLDLTSHPVILYRRNTGEFLIFLDKPLSIRKITLTLDSEKEALNFKEILERCAASDLEEMSSFGKIGQYLAIGYSPLEPPEFPEKLSCSTWHTIRGVGYTFMESPPRSSKFSYRSTITAEEMEELEKLGQLVIE